MISRICEEFHCTPLEAMMQPLDLCRHIMLLRGYEATKRLIDRPDTKQSDLPDSPMVGLVLDVETMLAHNRKKERRA